MQDPECGATYEIVEHEATVWEYTVDQDEWREGYKTM
jgi:hypothetical protein